MRRIFRNEDWNKTLEEKGFVIRPLLSDEEVEACREVYNTYFPDTEISKYNTLEINDHHYRTRVEKDLKVVLEGRIAEYVIDYKFIGVNFAVKKAGSDEEFEMHIDDDHCDRRRHRGLNVWVPLIDVNKGNGGLYIVPKSHLLPPTINGIGAPFPFREYRELFLENAYFVEMKAGEALYFDDRIIHGSLTNPTDENRIAIISGMIPKEADYIMYINHDGLNWPDMELFEADDELLLKLEIGKRPEGYKSHGVFKQEVPEISSSEIIETIS